MAHGEEHALPDVRSGSGLAAGVMAFPSLERPAEGVLASGIRRLHPACFDLVMATGIVSVGGRLLGIVRQTTRILAPRRHATA